MLPVYYLDYEQSIFVPEIIRETGKVKIMQIGEKTRGEWGDAVSPLDRCSFASRSFISSHARKRKRLLAIYLLSDSRCLTNVHASFLQSTNRNEPCTSVKMLFSDRLADFMR